MFDPAAHTYALDGVRVPGVTDVIRAAGLMPDMRFASDWHLERGRLVHAATHMHDEDDLDESQLDPEIAGRVRAWQAFRAEAGARFVITAIERPCASSLPCYAGTPDRVGTWDGRPCVVDIKAGEPADWHAIQLAAYRALTGTVDRLGVYLRADGTYKLVTYAAREDWPVFAGALACYHWRQTRDLLTPR